MPEVKPSEIESLAIIREMIATAKQEQRDDGKGWIIWGWMIFTTSLLTVANMQFHWFNTFMFWNIFGILAIILMVYSAMNKRRRRAGSVKTYTGDLLSKLDAGFTISLFFIIIMINVVARQVHPDSSVRVVNAGFSLLVSLYAFWILIYGTALSFRPSVIAAYATWVIGIVSLFQSHFVMVMCLHALSALVGYIIPGYIANHEFKKMQRPENPVARV
jgi:hypothetical protein